MLQLHNCTREEFVSCITKDKGDSFAKTFVAKADMQKQWEYCIGAYVGDKLLGAIITTISKRQPLVANLQLLHTFVQHRAQGVGKRLCDESLVWANSNQAQYFRVSAEIPAVAFYEKIGLRFWGKQKSGCQLSMFRIGGNVFSEGIYDYWDPIIHKAINSGRKGSCVEVFELPEDRQMKFDFLDQV
jgi:GNAT superfamily N-acetyltransferase